MFRKLVYYTIRILIVIDCERMVKILVIEDSPELRQDVVDILELEGFEVADVAGGLDGLKAAREFRPDLIICDVLMPDLNGYRVLEELRDDPQTAMIPLIFLTARTEHSNMRRGMALGADDYVEKPFLVDELINSINAQLAKRERLNRLANERMDELRKNITTALPHEFRTPLNAILGYSDLLITESEIVNPTKIHQWATQINEAAGRLYHLVENYLDFARLQAMIYDGQPPPRDVLPLPLSNIISSEAARISERYGRSDDLDLQVEPIERIQMSHKHAVKLVTELIDNAFKFSHAGSSVEVEGLHTDEGYVFTVRDYGSGITDEQVDAIGAYMQFDRAEYEQQGLGLGLTIVNLLSQYYGLRFAIQGEGGGGTLAHLLFPE